MELQLGKQYRTRSGQVATITQDLSFIYRMYVWKGFVADDSGEVTRAICMWTSSGIYNISHQTGFDIVAEIEVGNSH